MDFTNQSVRALIVACLVSTFIISAMTVSLGTQHSSIPVGRLVLASGLQPPLTSFITNYSIPMPKNSAPDAIIPGPNQTLWFTEYGAGSIGEFNSTTKTFSNYTIPEAGARPVTLTFNGPSQIWFTDQNPGSPSVWMMNLTGKPSFRQFLTNAQNSSPVFILADEKTRNIWFTDTPGGYLGEIDHSTLHISRFPAPTSSSGPVEITQQNGTSYIWASEISGKVARYDTTANSTQEYTPSVPLSYPVGIVLDQHNNVWVSEHGGSAIVAFSPSNSTWRKYPTSEASGPPGSGPATLAIDGQGRFWFAEHYVGKIGRLDPASGSMEEFTIPFAGAYSLLNSFDSKGDFWFAMAYANSIGVIPSNATSSITVSPASIPTPQVTSGQTILWPFTVTNDLSTTVTLTLAATSFFTTNYSTTSSEISLSNSGLTLGPGETRIVTARITPDFSLSSGIYTAGVVAAYGSVASIGSFFLQVNASQWYTLETLLPAILIAVALAAVLAFVLMRRKRTIGGRSKSPPVPKASIVVTLALLFITLIQGTGQSWAKCPGLPPPPVNPNGASPDYYGIALDIGSIAFFGIVAYLLIRDRLRSKAPPSNSS